MAHQGSKRWLVRAISTTEVDRGIMYSAVAYKFEKKKEKNDNKKVAFNLFVTVDLS